MESSPIKELAESLVGAELEDGEFITESFLVVRTQSLEHETENVALIADADRVATSTLVGMLEMAKLGELMPAWMEDEDDDE